jgi:oligopeptide/dipeptide ABC transporter ATP-binding protein
MLNVQDLKMYFPVRRGLLRRPAGFVKAVDGVSFTVGRGETLGLVGESGCGKTTVGKCVVRLLKPTEGRIVFDGLDIAALKDRALRQYRSKAQMIFQDPFGSLNPMMTVSDIVAEGPAIMGDRKAAERVGELLDMVGLPEEARSRYPHEFSGGQRQRIGIARALAVNPSFLVCDEPVSALDVSIQAQIINLLEDLQERLSLSYLFVAHDLAVVRHIADRICVMYGGQIMEQAPTEALFAEPLHPYTQALFSSIPTLDPACRRSMPPPAGELPSAAGLPDGCRFAAMCPESMPRCREGKMDFAEVAPGRYIRCNRYAGTKASS